jgi:histone deacetylase 6
MLTKTYLLHDHRMALHHPLPATQESDDNSPPCENRDRIFAIYNQLLDLEDRLHEKAQARGVVDYDDSRRFLEIPCLPASRHTVELVHSPEHYDKMRETQFMSENELRELAVPDDVYFNNSTFLAASLACGGVVQCVDAVTDYDAESKRAIAVVRPPGHHAGMDEAMGEYYIRCAIVVSAKFSFVDKTHICRTHIGFCYFNNVAVAAKHALTTGRARRVFILDWDIHHGNGIQDVTYDDPRIFYLSIHRASFTKSSARKKSEFFYPGTGRHTDVGEGAGTGTNLNIVWGHAGMGNVEYAAAFCEVVLPALTSFNPDLIIVACGLDAAEGDLLGDCGLSPDMYYTMTESLVDAAGQNIPIVVALEGGYNIEVSANCMEKVALALFEEPLVKVKPSTKKVQWWKSILSSDKCKDLYDIDATHGRTLGLSKYWSHDKMTHAENKRETRFAVSSLKKSAKALAKEGVCLGGQCHFAACQECRPFKKRKFLGSF